MKRQLAGNLWLFYGKDAQADAEFIEWCHQNPAGFFWSCHRTRGTQPDLADVNVKSVWTLHAAILGDDLCPHFKNKNRASGYEANLTTGKIAKVCSTHRGALEEWAAAYRGDRVACSHCCSR